MILFAEAQEKLRRHVTCAYYNSALWLCEIYI